MTLTSYAQNFEDVLLHRALAGVTSGTYIDVGAGDPELDSVTKAFSDEGWTGINIEPLSAFHERLVSERPRDVNIRAAVTDKPGTVALFEVEGYAELSTTVPEIAADLNAHGRIVVEHLVPARTLADICAQHVTGPVHFLKIDVEGAELAVLRGADLSAVRPWIIVVEVVTFGGATDHAAELDGILAAAGYFHVYFDGLNAFYLADEQSDRATAFEVPVNVRDDFRIPVEGRARLTLERLAAMLGLESFVDEHEVIERLESLRADRIGFETASLAARGDLEEVRAERDAALAAGSAFEIELDASRQQSFERERYIAWQAGEILRAQLAVQAEAGEGQARLAAILRSTSWRMTLPMRVVRRPALYLRKLRGR